MSLSTRKLMLAAAAVAISAAVSAPAFAYGSHGGHGGGHVSAGPGHKSAHVPPRGGRISHRHPRFHRVFIGGRWIVRPVGYIEPVAVVAPVAAPCTCLTKAYTPEGQVVFTDTCTKEAAIGPLPEQQTSEAQPQPK